MKDPHGGHSTYSPKFRKRTIGLKPTTYNQQSKSFDLFAIELELPEPDSTFLISGAKFREDISDEYLVCSFLPMMNVLGMTRINFSSDFHQSS